MQRAEGELRPQPAAPGTVRSASLMIDCLVNSSPAKAGSPARGGGRAVLDGRDNYSLCTAGLNCPRKGRGKSMGCFIGKLIPLLCFLLETCVCFLSKVTARLTNFFSDWKRQVCCSQTLRCQLLAREKMLLREGSAAASWWACRWECEKVTRRGACLGRVSSFQREMLKALLQCRRR